MYHRQNSFKPRDTLRSQHYHIVVNIIPNVNLFKPFIEKENLYLSFPPVLFGVFN